MTASAEPLVNSIETRLMIVSLFSRGMISEAKTNATRLPGMTDSVWMSIEKMMNPIRAFVQDGTLQYPAYDNSTEYAGLPTPPDEQPPPEGGETRDGEDTSASALIARARAATTAEELDEVENLAAGRVTVEDAVDARREELTKP